MSLEKPLELHDIDVVVFDFDGTLYSSSAGIEQQLKPLMCKHAAVTLGMDEKEARAILAKYRKEHKSSVLGLAANHGVDPNRFYERVYSELDISKMCPYAGLAEAIRRLGVSKRLALLTNSNRSFTLRGLAKLNLVDVFKDVITVEDNGFIRKPNEEVYHALYARLSVVPSQLVMFDDIASSLKVLNRLGSKTILVGNGLREAPGFLDLHTGEEFSEAPSYVTASTHDLTAFINHWLNINN